MQVKNKLTGRRECGMRPRFKAGLTQAIINGFLYSLFIMSGQGFKLFWERRLILINQLLQKFQDDIILSLRFKKVYLSKKIKIWFSLTSFLINL